MNIEGGWGGKKQKLPVLFVLESGRPHPVHTPISVWNVLVKEAGEEAWVVVES